MRRVLFWIVLILLLPIHFMGLLMAFVRVMLRASREPWTWGLDTTPPAIDPARELVERCGLRLQHYSVYGREGDRKPPPGGLVVAEVA